LAFLGSGGALRERSEKLGANSSPDKEVKPEAAWQLVEKEFFSVIPSDARDLLFARCERKCRFLTPAKIAGVRNDSFLGVFQQAVRLRSAATGVHRCPTIFS
jgi:hypothetical protein